MDVLIVVPRNEESGLGHFHRMEALAWACDAAGHQVGMHVFGEAVPFNVPGVAVHFGTFHEVFVAAAARTGGRQDWVVLDFPEIPPGLLAGLTGKTRVCVVDGVGHESEAAHLVISQGFEGEHSAPEHLLLRQGLAGHRWTGPEGPTLVWGGGADPMGLVPRFLDECRDEKAFVLPSVFAKGGASYSIGGNHWVARAEDSALFGMMATCGKAVVASGMILWELAALGVPTYAFSKTERHLETAMRMEDAGLVLAWPEVGLPPSGAMAGFVDIPFVPVGKRPDCLGPMRVVRLMERGVE